MRLVIGSRPFTGILDGHDVPGRVRAADGATRANAMAAVARLRPDAGDGDNADALVGLAAVPAMIDVVTELLDEVAVVLDRGDGVDWPLPVHGHAERRQWVSYLPLEVLGAAFNAALGSGPPLSEGDSGN